MTDREEREEHIKRLEASLACEEKQFSGKCSKQTCDDNCSLIYEQGNWGEWKETLRYAIDSLKTDLRYDLLYEGTSGLTDKPTTKNDLGVSSELEKNSKKLEKDFGELDCISRAQAQTKIEMNASRYTIAKERGGMGQVEWSDQLIKVSDAVSIIRELTSVTPQPKIGHWIEEFNDLEGEVRFTCSSCGKYQLFGTDFCYHCGSDNREVEE